jgi:predicted nuclease with TOPRIM domain
MSNHVPSLKHKLDEALKEIQRLKGSPKVQEQLNMANKTVAELMEQNALLKADNELLENSYTEVNKDYKCLLDKFTEISAENYALKASQTLTVQEQQPLVVNHYHNCVINK